jgi:hypothetical protein
MAAVAASVAVAAAVTALRTARRGGWFSSIFANADAGMGGTDASAGEGDGDGNDDCSDVDDSAWSDMPAHARALTFPLVDTTVDAPDGDIDGADSRVSKSSSSLSSSFSSPPSSSISSSSSGGCVSTGSLPLPASPSQHTAPCTIHVVSTYADCERWCALLLSEVNGTATASSASSSQTPFAPRVVGLDCEWETKANVPNVVVGGGSGGSIVKRRIRRPVALLQLCGARTCVIVQMHALVAAAAPLTSTSSASASLSSTLSSSSSSSSSSSPFPPSLRRLLADASLLKAGVGIRQDASKLSTDYALSVVGCVDLRPLLRRCAHGATAATSAAAVDVHGGHGEGLAALSARVLHVRMRKDATVACGRWELRSLSRRQVLYAAADAYVGFALFVAMFARRNTAVKSSAAVNNAAPGDAVVSDALNSADSASSTSSSEEVTSMARNWCQGLVSGSGGNDNGNGGGGDATSSAAVPAAAPAPAAVAAQRRAKADMKRQRKIVKFVQHRASVANLLRAGWIPRAQWRAVCARSAALHAAAAASASVDATATDNGGVGGGSCDHANGAHSVDVSLVMQCSFFTAAHASDENDDGNDNVGGVGDTAEQARRVAAAAFALALPPFFYRSGGGNQELRELIKRGNRKKKWSTLYTRKGKLYDNCQLQAPDGTVVSTCARDRADWYIAKGLGVRVDGGHGGGDGESDEPLVVRLKFKPGRDSRLLAAQAAAVNQVLMDGVGAIGDVTHGDAAAVEAAIAANSAAAAKKRATFDGFARSGSASTPFVELHPYYRTRRIDQCVVCGARKHLLKHSVVPSEYRTHFPLRLKKHSSHDVLLACFECHERWVRFDNGLKTQIEKWTGVPLTQARGTVTLPAATKVGGAASARLCIVSFRSSFRVAALLTRKSHF